MSLFTFFHLPASLRFYLLLRETNTQKASGSDKLPLYRKHLNICNFPEDSLQNTKLGGKQVYMSERVKINTYFCLSGDYKPFCFSNFLQLDSIRPWKIIALIFVRQFASVRPMREECNDLTELDYIDFFP